MRESEKVTSEEQQFVEFLRKAMREMPGENVNIPFVIDKEFLDRVLEQKSRTRSIKTSVSYESLEYYGLAHFRRDGIGYHFFMLCKVSSYDNCMSWLATTRDNTLLDAKEIAPFKQTLTLDDIGTLYINLPEIRVEIKSVVKYPIEQVNEYSKRFTITPAGRIYQQADN